MKLRQICEVEVPDEWDNDIDSSDLEQKLKGLNQRIESLNHTRQLNSAMLAKHKANGVTYGSNHPDYDKFIAQGGFLVTYPHGNKSDVIPKTTPNGAKLAHLFSKLYAANANIQKEIDKLERKVKQVKKEYREQRFSRKENVGLPEAEIKKLSKTSHFFIGKKKIANPVAVCNQALYAGPPDGYPDLTSTQIDYYIDIQQALKVAGMQPLTMLYGGRIANHGGINFVIINGDSKFAWRKYDPSPGAGQNWVYFNNGTHMNTSTFMDDPVKCLKDNTL
jgi:hypothetical protein